MMSAGWRSTLSPRRNCGAPPFLAWLIVAGALSFQAAAFANQETGDGNALQEMSLPSQVFSSASWHTFDPARLAGPTACPPEQPIRWRPQDLFPARPADFLSAPSRLAAFLGEAAGDESPGLFDYGGISFSPRSVITRQEQFTPEILTAIMPLKPFLDLKIHLPESHYGRLPDDDASGSIFYEARIPPPDRTRFNWDAALGQSFLFMTGLHTLRVATQADTRAELGGPFLKDYVDTLKRLGGWSDGDTFFTNYTLHPMMGAAAGFIQIQNDPEGMVADFGASSQYWNSRMQAFAWSTAFSFLFELGPMSEANIGNVGLHPRDSSEHPMAWVDLVVTPVVGTMWLVGEDALDRYVVSRIEDTGWNNHVKATFRVALNPSRTIANIARLKTPWHRD